jgi:superfamily II DNA or RNA helicase
MQLIACPRLTKDDVEAILKANGSTNELVENRLLRDLATFENEMIADHVSALGWMIASGYLEIRLCIPADEGRGYNKNGANSSIFHQKVGILEDSEGRMITFSGSLNETAQGWLGNIEEFKVFRSWAPQEAEYQIPDIDRFAKLWNGHSTHARTMCVPQAVAQRLVDLAPDNIKASAIWEYYKNKHNEHKHRVKLYDYQKAAIRAWLDNEMCGLFEMATGTGKTFTAIGCLDRAFLVSNARVAVIASPYQHLSQQWRRELDKFGLDCGKTIVADSSNRSWKDELSDSLIDITIGHLQRLTILTTHDTLTSRHFAEIFHENRDRSAKTVLIADEVHGLGAEKAKTRLDESFQYRLGLSATPSRWLDSDGTEAIMDYFGGVVFEFPLDKAIGTINPATGKTFLTPFRYEPRFVSLTPDELEDYLTMTQKLARMKDEDSDEAKYMRQMMLIHRATIVKNAEQKLSILAELLDELGEGLRLCFIYCSPDNPTQMQSVIRLLRKKHITLHRFTKDEGVTPNEKFRGLSQREYILNRFAQEDFQVLVAMKCLDEGVDVPPARIGVLLCSSSNPREYVQRIGRLIRRYPNKRNAVIYDLIVRPSLNSLPVKLRELERSIFKKEMRRCKEIASYAENSAEAMRMLMPH